jgi:hypothetical protein
MSDDNVNCFVARCKCGKGLVFAAVDQPDRRKDNAKEVAGLIRAGYRVDNMPLLEVRKSTFCFECKSPKKEKRQPQQSMLV